MEENQLLKNITIGAATVLIIGGLGFTTYRTIQKRSVKQDKVAQVERKKAKVEDLEEEVAPVVNEDDVDETIADKIDDVTSSDDDIVTTPSSKEDKDKDDVEDEPVSPLDELKRKMAADDESTTSEQADAKPVDEGLDADALAEKYTYAYEAHGGDTVETIAALTGVSADVIAEANNLKVDSKLSEGQVIYIP